MPPIKRCSVDEEHFIRFHVWTENFCSVFALKVAFSNLSGIVWTRPKSQARFAAILETLIVWIKSDFVDIQGRVLYFAFVVFP